MRARGALAGLVRGSPCPIGECGPSVRLNSATPRSIVRRKPAAFGGSTRQGERPESRDTGGQREARMPQPQSRARRALELAYSRAEVPQCEAMSLRDRCQLVLRGGVRPRSRSSYRRRSGSHGLAAPRVPQHICASNLGAKYVRESPQIEANRMQSAHYATGSIASRSASLALPRTG